MDPYMTLQGRLVADPTQQAVASGYKVTKFRLAASGRRFDQALQTWINTEAVFITVACWRQLGENVLLSLRKGDAVVVRGRLRFHEWDTDQGKRQSYDIEAQSVGPDLARYVVDVRRPVRDAAEVPPQQPSAEDPADVAQGDPWGGGGVAAREPSVA